MCREAGRRGVPRISGESPVIPPPQHPPKSMRDRKPDVVDTHRCSDLQREATMPCSEDRVLRGLPR